MSQKRLDDYTTTIVIKKEQKEKLDELKYRNRLKTYAEVIDFLIKHYEKTHTHQPETSSNTEDEDSEIVEEVKTFQSMIMPAELEEKIAEACKNNPELRAYVLFFVKKYKLDKYRQWAEQWNREIDCSKWT